MAFSTDAQRLISVAVDGSVAIWDLSSIGAPLQVPCSAGEPNRAICEMPGIGPEDADGLLEEDPTEKPSLMDRLEESSKI